MECKNCCYYWRDTDNEGNFTSNEYCHYKYNDGYAPCEIDEAETETEDIDED